MKNDRVLEEMMNDPKIRNLGIKKEVLSSIIDSYNEAVINALLDSGHIEYDTGMNIEIVKLIDRVHVLRGISYSSNRKYKLKLTMEDKLYDKIASYYDALLEELL